MISNEVLLGGLIFTGKITNLWRAKTLAVPVQSLAKPSGCACSVFLRRRQTWGVAVAFCAEGYSWKTTLGVRWPNGTYFNPEWGGRL